MSENTTNNIKNNDTSVSVNELKKTALNLANKIYDLDERVYKSVGSELGRVFIGDKTKCIDKLSALIYSNPHGYTLRSEVALVGNMARTIQDKKEKSKFMTEYNDILKEIAEITKRIYKVIFLTIELYESLVSFVVTG